MEQDLRDALAKIYELVAVKTDALEKEIKKISEETTTKKFLNKEFFELNGADTFVKLKANSFGIGKVQFAFVKFDKNTNKLLSSMDVYLDMEDALVLANDILSGRIAALAEAEKAKGAQYPGAIWNSGLGGVSEEKAKNRGLRNDGKAISRMFTLAPGSRQPFVFTAEQRPGKTDSKGLIVPEYSSKPEVQIRVPGSADELKKMAVAIQSNIIAYRAGQYANKEFDVDPTTK